LLFLALAAGSAGARSPQAQPRVEQLQVDADGSRVEVRVTASADVRYTYFRLDGPRLVLDLHDTLNALGFSQRNIESGGVARVRAAPFADATRQVTRVVFDLESGTTFGISEPVPGQILVRFEARPVSTVPPALELAEAATPSPVILSEPRTPEVVANRMSLPGSGVRVAGVEGGRVEASGPVQIAALMPPGLTGQQSRESAPLGLSSLAREGRGSSASALVALLTSPVTPAEAAPVPVEPAPAPVEPAPAPVEPAAAPQAVSPIPTPQYTGEVYSFDFVDLRLQDFFRTIADISGLNIILHPSVPDGTLDMTLYDVPWDQALDIVLNNFDLSWELQGNVLQILTEQAMQEREDRLRQLRQAQEENGPLVQRTYVLSYAQAADSAPLVSNLLTTRGAVVPVAQRNSLIVTDIETRFEAIENLIGFLDTPAQQVQIEARLLQANKTFRRDLGNQIGLIVNNNGSNVLTGVPTLPSPFERTPPPAATAGGTSALPLIADFGITAPAAGISFLLGVGGDILLDEIIQVAENRGTARLLSRPDVVTQNNEAATIEQIVEIPVQTNVNNTITTQFQEFGLRLEVTPQITAEGTILLTALIENSTPDFSQTIGNTGIPAISTQRAQTRVLIADGATAMIGGILIDSDSVSVSQVPGLGSIPIIGHLFKSTSTVKGTSELLFFVTARIKPAEPLDFLSASSGAFPLDPNSLFALDSPEAILQGVPELATPGVD
jgi:type IV pilus assembly protein PilQ